MQGARDFAVGDFAEGQLCEVQLCEVPEASPDFAEVGMQGMWCGPKALI